jgi:hypothetical protein
MRRRHGRSHASSVQHWIERQGSLSPFVLLGGANDSLRTRYLAHIGRVRNQSDFQVCATHLNGLHSTTFCIQIACLSDGQHIGRGRRMRDVHEDQPSTLGSDLPILLNWGDCLVRHTAKLKGHFGSSHWPAGVIDHKTCEAKAVVMRTWQGCTTLTDAYGMEAQEGQSGRSECCRHLSTWARVAPAQHRPSPARRA